MSCDVSQVMSVVILVSYVNVFSSLLFSYVSMHRSGVGLLSRFMRESEINLLSLLAVRLSVCPSVYT